MVKKLLPYVPPHNTYVETFGGGASLLFAKEPAIVEVYNDKLRYLVNFFEVLRDYPDEFINAAEWMPYSRYEFNKSRLLLKEGHLDKVEQALRFFVMCRQSMSGDVQGGWAAGIETAVTSKWTSAVKKLPKVRDRLFPVQIENLDALDCIKKYDTENTFFYCDPPYMQSTRSDTRYMHDYTESDHEQLLDLLLAVKGMVLLSGYHSTLYDSKLSGWHYKEFDVACYSAGHEIGMTRDRRTEVIWWNEKLEEARNGLQMVIF